MIHRLKHHLKRHTHFVKHHLHNAFVPHEGNDHRPHALRHKALTAYALAIVAVKVIVSGLLLWYPGPSLTSNFTANAIIRLTNSARIENKLKALNTNQKLNAAAQLKAQDMLTKGYFAHVSPQKITPWYWFKKAGYGYSSAGENLAMDFVAAEDVTEAWLNSPSHRRNLLNSKYLDIGVAVADGKFNNVSTTVVVQFFGLPAPVQQQPKKIAKVTPAKPPKPVKKSSVAAAAPKPEDQPPVLGEEAEPSPPASPKLTSPGGDAVLATDLPWIGGEAQPETAVELYSDGQNVGATTSDENGYFRLQPSVELADGAHRLTAVAVSDSLVSAASNALSITVDTKPPSTGLQSVAVWPSYFRPGTYVVSGTFVGEDVSSACIRLGTACTDIPLQTEAFAVNVAPAVGGAGTLISLEVRDAVGNLSVVPVASLAFLDLDIVQPAQRGALALISKLVFYSRNFFITFWLFLFLALAINVIVRIRIQHRPVILYTLLLLYGLTIVMITM